MSRKQPKNILVTAFEPFDGETLNPSAGILESLPDTIDGHRIRKLLLPVEFAKSRELAVAAYDALSPDAVIMLGQAGGRSAITPETTARNEMTARIPDNAGYQPVHVPVVPGRPDVLYSTLPTEKIVQTIHALGIPCESSDDAGTYVCNALFYSMLNRVNRSIPAGFIHIPYIREQEHEDKPFLAFEAILKGITAAIRTVVPDSQENGL